MIGEGRYIDAFAAEKLERLQQGKRMSDA